MISTGKITLKDLEPSGDVKAGTSQPDDSKKPKSDQLRNATVGEYIKAHSKGYGNGWHGFFRSNLFVALMIWILSQAVLLGTSYLLNYARTTALIEWKSTVDATLKRMDDWGTVHGHYTDERQDRDIIKLQSITETESQLPQAINTQAERNNEQDKKISELQAQMTQIIPSLVEIKTKLNFVADLLDERTKNKR